MVVLSAAVVTTSKTLVARQFVEMTRLRVEGLVSAFQKLVDSGRDHTFIETETVRYVYQPMETLHLVLVTNKSSNILEDLETLRLLAKVVQDCCQAMVSEESVLKNALDIVFAFDEVISFGHRESVTLSQVKTFTEMDSHEEKLHQMIEQSKINEAREMAKKKQQELKKQRAADAKNNPGGGSITMQGFGSSDSMGGGPSSLDSGVGQESMSGGGGGGSGLVAPREMNRPAQEVQTWNPAMNEDSAATFQPKARPNKGMALGKKKPVDIFAGLGGGADAGGDAPAAEAAQQEEAPAPVVNPLREPVSVTIREQVTADLDVEGGLKGDATCNGSFEVVVNDTSKADLVSFKLAPQSQDFKYKVHPNLNKASYANNVLEVRDGVPAFPSGGCLRWMMKTSDDAFLPITLACWPTPTSDGTRFVVELELTDDSASLESLIICFPAAASARPAVSSFSPGEAAYMDGKITWIIPMFDKSDPNGTLEFTANADSASLFPARITAVQTTSTRCPMNILECCHQVRKDPLDFACEKKVIYELKVGS